MDRKVVFLGIDAGNRLLIRQWAKEGTLPTFRKLFDKGLQGDTMSLPGLYTGATWPSFQTGANPARSGCYAWMQLKPGTYEQIRCLTGETLRCQPFWNHLSRAGRRVIVLDIPLSAVTEHLNGKQVVEWGTHDTQYGLSTWPPSLARDIVSRFGRYPLRDICNGDRDTEGFVEFRDQLLRGIATKTEITKHFLRRDDCDFFAQVWSESHCVGHQCWHIHDPSHPRHDEEQARVVGDPLKQVYVAIDAAIGEVLKEISEDTTVVVLASHGMSYKYGSQILLEQILLALGVAAPAPPAPPPPPPKRRMRDRLDPLLGWGWNTMPAELRKALQPIRKPLVEWMSPERAPRAPLVNPAESRCFIVENNHAHGGIRVNLVGREPNGKIEPGSELDAFCEELTRDLLDIVDLDRGQPVVRRVLRTDSLYHGEHRDWLPDLLVDWSNYVPISKVRLGSKKIGELSGEYRFCRTGDHFPGGMFVATGPGIQPGRLSRTVSIMDFAPTFCRMLDVDLPDVDGSPIGELVASVAAHA